jgi:hypothetical protein
MEAEAELGHHTVTDARDRLVMMTAREQQVAQEDPEL